jgi:histone demethylase JARID1
MAKPGVHQQLEYEYGGPLGTPSPANSPMKKSHQHTPSSLRGDSPAMRASEAFNAHIKESNDLKNIPMLDSPVSQSTPAPSSGFTPVNSGGFTPVNAASAAFTPVSQIHRREREPERSFTPPRHSIESPLSSAKNTPDYRPSGLGSTPLTNLTNGYTSNPLKRQLSVDSVDSRKENNNPDSENGGRRSKRLKKGM